VGVFDRFKRKPESPPEWNVYREGGEVVADDGRGGTYRVELRGARSVRIVPLTHGNPHSGSGMGYQVAVRLDSGDAPVGKPSMDWRAARELARRVCDIAELPLDELTERLFSQVGRFDVQNDVKSDA